VRIDRGLMVAVLFAVTTVPLYAQDALSRINAQTQVASINFRYEDHETLSPDTLRQRIALAERGSLVGLRRLFGFLPFVPSVGTHPFDPLELERDVIRLRHYYDRSGFLKAAVHYDVRYDAKSNVVNVTFLIREGPPLAVRSLTFTANGGELTVPPEHAADWSNFMRHERQSVRRLGEQERLALGDSTSRWFRHVGYPFALANPQVTVDSAANQADVTVRVQPGQRARIRAIDVTGNSTVPPGHFSRMLPIHPGEWYDGTALEEGRRTLTQMDLVRLALIDVPRDSARDSTVVVQLHVTENPRRVVRGDAGLASGAGLNASAQWTNRAFLGGLRTFTVAGIAQTGTPPLAQTPQRLYRLSLTFNQPYLGDRHMSLAAGPFVEYRDDILGRSRAAGLTATLVYAAGPLRSISLGYTFSYRRILNFGFGAGLPPSQLLPIFHLADSAAAATLNVEQRSVVSLEGTYGRLDQLANPRRGYVIRPRIAVTTPGGYNNADFFLFEMNGTAFVPLTRRIGLTLRASGGRLYPFGRSLQGVGALSPIVSLLNLRDVTFTAGGARDVRGWGSGLLGPKLPQLQIDSTGSTVDTTAPRYTPVGGLARLTGSLEFQLPLPGFGDQWRAVVFSDLGRIWSPDSRFQIPSPTLIEDNYFVSAGVGFGYQTVVGAVQIAVGYKLNPSLLDERSPDSVAVALEAQRPIQSIPADALRRLHVSFSIGATF
jgi:outer membrane protein insertion porin family